MSILNLNSANQPLFCVGGRVFTSSSSVIESYFAICQTSKEDRVRVSEAEDWAAIWVHEGQQALNSCVEAAVHQDATKTKYKKNNKISI